jgi:hypothetical protein
MRLTIATVLCVLVLPAAEIPKGSHVLLKLVNSISTRTAKEGDYVYMTTATPIVNEGEVVVPTGAYVTGIVTHSKRSGRVKGTAELSLRIDTLTLASGKVVKMQPRLAAVDSQDTDQKVVSQENEVKQGTDHGRDAATIATTAGVGASIGAIVDRSWKGAGIGAGAGSGVGLATVLLTRGREVDLHQGATIDVIFDRAVAVE